MPHLVPTRGQFIKGHKKLGGRKKGSPTIQDVRNAVLAAFGKLGGEQYLVNVAKKSPSVYLALLARILPQETSMTYENKTPIARLNVAELNDLRQRLLTKNVEPDPAPRVEH